MAAVRVVALARAGEGGGKGECDGGGSGGGSGGCSGKGSGGDGSAVATAAVAAA